MKPLTSLFLAELVVFAFSMVVNDQLEIMKERPEVKRYRVEGDMMLSPVQKAEYDDAKRAIAYDDIDKKGGIIPSEERTLWTNGIVPYVIEPELNDKMKMIEAALLQWEDRAPCLKFVPRKSELNYILFIKGYQGDCFSDVGMQGSGQVISLGPGCDKMYIVLHEIGHAIGLVHTQNRPDRDKYITIHKDRIAAEGKIYEAFTKYKKGSVSTYDLPYDFDSVMHYRSLDYSKNGLPVITTKPPGKRKQIDRIKNEISIGDKKLVRRMYGCKKQ